MSLGNYPTIFFETYADAIAPDALGNKRKYVIIQENENAGDVMTFHFFDGEDLQDITGGTSFDPEAFARLSREVNVFAGKIKTGGIVVDTLLKAGDYTLLAADAGKDVELSGADQAVELTINPEDFTGITIRVRCIDNTNEVSVKAATGVIELTNGLDTDSVSFSRRETILLKSDGTNLKQL